MKKTKTMKKFISKSWALVILLALTLSFGPGLASAKISDFKNPDREPKIKAGDYVPDEIVVKYKNDNRPFRIVKVKKGQVMEEIGRYQNKKDVEFVGPNYYAQAYEWAPNDPFYLSQWHFDSINMEMAWGISNGTGAVVAVIDTGINTNGEDTPVCIKNGWNFVSNNNDPFDGDGHGTHVAGTIAQATNNGAGVAGIAYNACIMPVKVLNDSGSGTYTDIINGIYYAVDNGAQVINMSLGGSSDLFALEEAVNYAYDNGVVVVAAAGNDGRPRVGYPAKYEKAIAVGATRYDNTKSYYSNYGSDLDIMAPGGDTRVDQNGDGYADGVLQETFGSDGWGYYFYQGTSMASPHVAGAAALVIANGNASGPAEVRRALEESARDLGTSGWDRYYGHGLVDAYAALTWGEVQPNQAPIADAGGPYTAEAGTAITFDGSASYDPDGSIASYSWDFGDGSTGSGVNPTHTYNTVNTVANYTVTLSVTDNEGATSNTDSTTVTVTEAVDDPPMVEIINPANGDTVSGTVLIQADVTDDYGVQYVEFCLGEDPCIADYDYPYEYSWDTSQKNDGPVLISINAYDSIGQKAGDSITVTVDNIIEPELFISASVSTVNIIYDRAIFYSANATVGVSPAVVGATVTGQWTDSGGTILAISSADTDSSGTASISQSLKKLSPGTYTFTVTGVSAVDYTWDGLESSGEASL